MGSFVFVPANRRSPHEAPRSPPPALSPPASPSSSQTNRDTFIALRGLLLVPGRLDDAKATILLFASTLRHGLIPNLLDGARNPRYNCRDAAWLFLQAIQDYCTFASREAGDALLTAAVIRKFPTDEPANAHSSPAAVPLTTVIQEILQRHAQGISFREWMTAGKSSLDNDMSDQGTRCVASATVPTAPRLLSCSVLLLGTGVASARHFPDPHRARVLIAIVLLRTGFDVTAEVDWNTGFVRGGSKYNCGTWMDKMGGSVAGGNKGVPATPRDGSAVEIVGLQYSSVHWLAGLHAADRYPHGGVELPAGGRQGRMSFQRWAELIEGSFEKAFWVPPRPEQDVDFMVEPDAAHRRGMYKDSFGSAAGFTDYQLRPNVCIAMVVAPGLFSADKARMALALMETVLVGGHGMRTLDPADWNYRPSYVNGNDTEDYATSKGFNYHQVCRVVRPRGSAVARAAAIRSPAHQLPGCEPGARVAVVRWLLLEGKVPVCRGEGTCRC